MGIRHAAVVEREDRSGDGRLQGSHWNADHLLPKISEPDDPAAGNSVVWMSDGYGLGDEGDIMVKINLGGTVKYATLVDYSTATPVPADSKLTFGDDGITFGPDELEF